MEEIVNKIASQIADKIGNMKPKIAIILGSGLSDVLDNMTDKIIVPFCQLDGMLQTRVEGHKNQFVIGNLHKKTVIAMQGRFHLYDGFSAKQVCLPIYIFKRLGVETLIVTNAAGGISYNAGDIMLIEDHINNTCQNSLICGAITNFGKEFIDMSEPYDLEYRNKIKQIAKSQNIDLKTGTYIQFIGPLYETKADIRMAKVLGADAVGMSTVVEVESARQCEMRVLGLSVITNKATGLQKEQLSHNEVLENSKKASKNLMELIDKFIETF